MIKENPTGEEPSAADAVDRQTREALAIAEVGRAVSESDGIEDLYEQIASCLRDLVLADRVVVAVVEPLTGELRREFVSEAAGGKPVVETSGQRKKPGILDEISATGKAARFDDLPGVVDRYPGLAELTASGFYSGVYAPLIVRGAVIGVIGADTREPKAYTDADLELLCRIASQIAGAVASSQLQLKSTRDARERRLLAEIGMAASSTLNLEAALDRVFGILGELLQVDRVSINIRTESSEALDYAYATGVPVPPRPGHITPGPSVNGLPALVASTGESRLIGEIIDVLDEAPGAVRMVDAGLKSAILVPLISDGETIGVLGVNKRLHGARPAAGEASGALPGRFGRKRPAPC